MEAERMKIHREVTSLDDEELWTGFEWEETDRILRGEITPKTLITTYMGMDNSPRGESIAMVLHSTIPNSRYVRREGIPLDNVIRSAKNDGFTSLVLTGRNESPHDELYILSLLNGAAVIFRIFEFIPPEDIPNRADPTEFHPHVHMENFVSPATLGAGRMIQSLFPKKPLSRKRSIIWLQNQNGFIFFRRHRLYFDEEALTGESARVRKKQECGPRLTVKLVSVEKLSFETGKFKWVCKPAKKALY